MYKQVIRRHMTKNFQIIYVPESKKQEARHPVRGQPGVVTAAALNGGGAASLRGSDRTALDSYKTQSNDRSRSVNCGLSMSINE